MTTVSDKVRAAAQKALRSTPRLTLPEWADRFRRLSTSSGAIGGPWRTSRVELARGPMLAATEKGVRMITIMSCTQVAKTSLLENLLGYFAHLDPCPILMTFPKDEAVTAFSKERLTPMADATPVLHGLLNDDRARGGKDTLGFKEFPGGFLAIESAGSPTNLAMRAIRVTLLDEIDKYHTTKEGDPVLLAEERTSTFGVRRLNVRTCSPTWEETSRIYKSYLESDQRRPFVRCPKCGYSQTLDFFRHVNWQKGDDGEHFPFTAAVYCESCGGEWTESERMTMMTARESIRWRQTRPFICCGERQEPLKTRRWRFDSEHRIGRAVCRHCGRDGVPNTHAGFQVSKLYSPFITIPELAAKWIECKDDPETKQTFYNTALGLPFKAQALKRVETNTLAERRESYPAQVPRGVVVLTVGIDVQSGGDTNEGRLECEVVGWGIGEESWSIAHQVFSGDPAKPALWRDLDEFLLQGFDYEDGGRMVIRAACIDSGGHFTQEVYSFARARVARCVWAIKGASDRPGQWSPVWPAPRLGPKRTRVTGFKPLIIGVNAAKEAIRQRLLIEERGPGFAHFPLERPEAWFDQLTSESLTIEKRGGFTQRKWVLPRGRANEALDCRVYAYAALCGLYATRKLNLERMATAIESLKPVPVRDIEAAQQPIEVAPEPVAPPAFVNRVRRSAFMG